MQSKTLFQRPVPAWLAVVVIGAMVIGAVAVFVTCSPGCSTWDSFIGQAKVPPEPPLPGQPDLRGVLNLIPFPWDLVTTGAATAIAGIFGAKKVADRKTRKYKKASREIVAGVDKLIQAGKLAKDAAAEAFNAVQSKDTKMIVDEAQGKGGV